jgi:6-phospho-beta-glucosidase
MKLVIIGGGSAYTPDIIAGLLRERKVFEGWELALQDIDPFNLQVIARLARGLVRTAGADMTITATTNRTQALSGARFVLTQPRVGGLKARALDERIPLKHGVIGQETLGPGGMAFAWRTIPVILDLVAEVQRVAPQAWIINYANPAGMVTEAVIRRFPGARFIGLCDMPTGIEWAIGKLLRVDFHRIALDYAGINHGGWSARVLLDGEDIMPRLVRWGRLLKPLVKILPLGEETATVRLFQQMGLVPDPYLRYYYFTEQIRRKLQRQSKSRAEVLMGRLPTLYRHYEAVSITDRPMLSLHRGHQSHGDLASQVIAAMASGRRTRFVIQQRNGGAVPNLPANEAAQFPAWVDANGWEPIKLDPLPDQLAGLLQQIKASESMNVEATLTGDVGLAIAAATANPLVPNRKTAETIVRELLRAHNPYVPQFQ